VSEDLVPVVHALVHAREALATDGRVGELGLEIDEELTADEEATVVVVRGAVSTDARKAAVVAVVAEVLRANGVQREVRDETQVTDPRPPPDEPEEL
jgi:hypothetical protein